MDTLSPADHLSRWRHSRLSLLCPACSWSAAPLPASPWTRPDFAAAEPVIGLSNGTVPEGTVMVPADLDQPRGPYQVFRCG